MKILTVSDRVEPALHDHFQAERFAGVNLILSCGDLPHLIDRYAPRYFIHGHMHFSYTTQAQRMTVVNETKVINSDGYFLFEIDDDQRTE